MKRLLFSTLTLGALIAAGSAGAATPSATATSFHGHELAGQAKLSLVEARTIALKARPGKIVDQELEKEGGGSGLRYSFDIASHHKTIEVGVDAMTGKLLENGAESAGKEAKEAVAEGKVPKN